MRNRIRRVIAEVLGVPVAEIGDEASPETLPSWDSLRHMNLIVALEEEFGITFDDAVLARLTSMPAIEAQLVRVAPEAA